MRNITMILILTAILAMGMSTEILGKTPRKKEIEASVEKLPPTGSGSFLPYGPVNERETANGGFAPYGPERRMTRKKPVAVFKQKSSPETTARYPEIGLNHRPANLTQEEYQERGDDRKPRVGDRGRTWASWYGPRFHGRLRADGERFNMHAVSAAHKTLPLGTKLRVTNPENGRSIILIINDRGPYIIGRGLDLSYEAARQLGFIRVGITILEYEIIELP